MRAWRNASKRFPELLKHQTAEERLASIAVERETWWQRMRERQAQLWRKARQTLRELPAGPRAAIKRYCEIYGCPGDPVYLLTIIHEHRARKVCYWHIMAALVCETTSLLPEWHPLQPSRLGT